MAADEKWGFIFRILDEYYNFAMLNGRMEE
jgi:hypothetical protein